MPKPLPPQQTVDHVVPRGFPARITGALLAAIMVVALVLHLWGIRRDLPFDPDIDEPQFVLAAVRIAATGNLNPGWFGNPGSTLIYPMAAVYRAWEVVDRAGFMQGISEFYQLGRYVSVAYALLSIPLVYLLGRLAFAGSEPTEGAVVGLIAAWFSVLSPLAVEHAQVTRTDSVSVFFTLLTLSLCMLLYAQPTPWRALLAGAASGLAVSTKYSLAALVPVVLIVLAVALWRETHRPPLRASPRRAQPAASLPNVWGCLIAAAVAAPLAFVASSPYLFLDSATALANLRTEARSTHLGADGWSPLQNFYWYIASVIPTNLELPRTFLAVAAAALAGWRRQAGRLILLGFVFLYLVEVSLHPLHWARWIIPLLPLCMLFAASALYSLVAAAGSRFHAPAAVRVIALLLAIACISYSPARSIIAADVIHAHPSTQIVAREWVIQNLPPGSRIAQEWFTAPLDKTGFEVGRQLSLADHSVEQYARAGYRYVMVSSAIDQAYLNEPERYVTEIAFYNTLSTTARLLQQFEPSATRGGPTVRIYELTPLP